MNDDILDEEFLEFLADLESIDNTWAHPVDFDDEKFEREQTRKKITATETDNE